MCSPRSSAQIRVPPIAWIVSLLFLLPATRLAALPAQIGDLDEDGDLTVLDVARLANHLKGTAVLTAELLPFADVNQDGVVNDQDVHALSQAVLGTLPAAGLPLATIRSTSPAQGEGAVAVTRETVIYFTLPLAPSTVVDGDRFHATFGGRRLLTRSELSSDRRKASLFFLEPLPGSSRVRVTFDGSGLTDLYGREIDVDGDGAGGGQFVLDFDTLSLTAIPGTAVVGRVFASELAPGNGPGQSLNMPLEGVTITVDGREEEMRAVTDVMGNFRLEPAPVGPFFVHIDGRTVGPYDPTQPYYPFVGKKWESVAGQEVSVGNIYLPLVTAGTLRPVSATEDTVVSFPQAVLDDFPELEGVVVTVPANSLFNDNGTRGGMVGIAPVPPDRIPSPLPPGLDFPLVITVQTDGASNFDRPVPVCFPNLPDPVTGLVKPPGAKSALWSFDHDVGDWVIVGPMTVSADGRLVCSDPGVGLLQPGWHGENQGVMGSGGRTRSSTPRDPTRPRPTAPQECAKNDCPCDGSCSTGSQVFLQSGEEVLTRSDLVIPGRAGLDFRMERTYRSRIDYNGPLGFGWTFHYNEGLFFESNGDVTRFTARSHEGTWALQPDGTYAPPPGYFSVLVREPDGAFLLVEPDGFQRYYREEDGRVFCHQDPFGNRMLFDYDDRGNLSRVIDVYGREVQFVFETFLDGVDRLVRLEDSLGRQVRYQYDARGDLVSVTTPAVTGTSTGNDYPNGRTERYAYSSGFDHHDLNHNLLAVTAPEEVASNGPPWLTWTYGNDPNDPVTFDRVLTETEGGVNASGVAAGGTRTFEYAMLHEDEPPDLLDLPRGRARITERNGNVKEFFVNERQLHILTREYTRGFRVDEPPFYDTRSFYDEDGQLVRRVSPEGNELRYAYDDSGPRRSRGNLVEVRQVADPVRGGGPDLVTTYTYEPLFNQVLTLIDPRGNDPAYLPSLGTRSADRYTTRFFYDYQESSAPVPLGELLDIDLAGVPRGLGDLNADGRTDQFFGNLVRVDAPSVRLRPDAHEAARLGSTMQPVISQIQWNDRGQLLARIDPEGNVTEYQYHAESDPEGDDIATHSPYVALSGQLHHGYLAAEIVDSRLSPRRDPAAPAPVALATTYLYDRAGNVIRIRNPRGVVTELEVNALNEIVAVVSGAQIAEAVQSGQLITGEPAYRYGTRFHYDANGRVILKQSENRDQTTPGVGSFVDQRFEFDILGQTLSIWREVDAQGGVRTEFRYDPDTLLVRTVQPEGNLVEASYDERNLLLSLTRGAGTSAAATVRFDYDRNGNRSRLIDAEDNDGDGLPEIVRIEHDGFDRTVVVIDPLGNRRLSTYDPASNEVRHQILGHPPGQPQAPRVLLEESRLHRDELDRVFQVDESLFVANGVAPSRPPLLRDHDDDGWVTSYREFDAASRLTFVTEDDHETLQTFYDGAHRPILTLDAAGNLTFLDYDRNSNPVRVVSREVSADGLVPDEDFVSVSVYDQLDRLVRYTDNAGQTSRHHYDSRNNLIAQSDAQGPLLPDPFGLFDGSINATGNTTLHVYDGLNRLVRTVRHLRQGGTGDGALDTTNPFNPDGQVTVGYRWDGNSRLTGIQDDNGNLTAFAYDPLDRRVRQINADGTEHSFVFDREDNLVRVTDPNGTITRHTPDVLNRRVRSEVIQLGAGVGGTRLATYEYDGLSRLTRSTDDNGDAGARLQTSEWIHDSLSRVIEERQNGRAISTQLSGDGKRLATHYPGGRRIERTFDPLDRIREQRDGALVVSESRWVGPGARELLRLHANQTALSFLDDAGNVATGYDTVRRPVRQRVLNSGIALIDREYAYNRADHRTSERRLDDGGLTDRYAYDSLYRVVATELDRDGFPASPRRALESLAYALDGAGNWRQVRESSSESGITATPFAVNAVNEYSQVGAVARSYSANGNLADDGTRLFVYDARDRLIAVRRKADQALIAEYRYDTENRRREKSVFDPNAPGVVLSRTRFFYDGWRVCEERDAAGQTTVTYVGAPGYLDALAQMQRTAAHPLGAGILYFHQNARHDVIALTDASGAVMERTYYDDFGRAYDEDKQPVLGSAIGNPHGFQGQRLDSETGLYYFRHRYYDPETGRFLQRDPIWDPQNLVNPYTFVGNSPISHVDPLGLEAAITIHFGGSVQGGAGLGASAGGGLVLQLGGERIADFGTYGSGAGGVTSGAAVGASLDVGVTFGSIRDFRDTTGTVGASCPVGGVSVDVDADGTPRTVRASVGPSLGAEAHTFATKTSTATVWDVVEVFAGEHNRGRGIPHRGPGLTHELGDPMDPAVRAEIDRRAEEKIALRKWREQQQRCEEEARQRRRAQIRAEEEAKFKQQQAAAAERQRQEEARRRAERDQAKRDRAERERRFNEQLERAGSSRAEYARETERRAINRPAVDQRTGRQLP